MKVPSDCGQAGSGSGIFKQAVEPTVGLAKLNGTIARKWFFSPCGKMLGLEVPLSASYSISNLKLNNYSSISSNILKILVLLYVTYEKKVYLA